MKQAIISTALELICSGRKDSSGKLIRNGNIVCSCPVLTAAIAHYSDVNLQLFELLSDSIMKEYREFSGARKGSSGFEGVELSEDIEQRQAYRQEMLYYFWMANQECNLS